MVKKALPRIAGLYRGVFGAASGAGIAIGAYFAFYGAATNILVRNTQMKPATIAFTAGAVAAAGGSIVKVPLAVCIRSVQAGVYPNVIKAASEITTAAGGLLSCCCHLRCASWVKRDNQSGPVLHCQGSAQLFNSKHSPSGLLPHTQGLDMLLLFS